MKTCVHAHAHTHTHTQTHTYQGMGNLCVQMFYTLQVLFWDQALDKSMTELEAQGAGDKLQKFAETDLPPRGLAVTRDNHLVVCTAEDPKKEAGEGSKSCILLMTMRGDILRRKTMDSHVAEPSGTQYFPRWGSLAQGSFWKFSQWVSSEARWAKCLQSKHTGTFVSFQQCSHQHSLLQ